MPHSVPPSHPRALQKPDGPVHDGRAAPRPSSTTSSSSLASAAADERRRAAARGQSASLMDAGRGPSAPLGARAVPSSHAREPYYTNDDIQLLHEIVTTGEEFLASLPDRERLPTNALFRAADIVLPKHGYDSEDLPHLSRLLFRVGGMRGDDSLLEKFRAVLESMHIELEFVDSTAPPSSASAASLDTGSFRLDGTPADPAPYAVRRRRRRRRNSEGVAPSSGGGPGQEDADLDGSTGPRRARSVSLEPSEAGPRRRSVTFVEPTEEASSDLSQGGHQVEAWDARGIPHRARPPAAPMVGQHDFYRPERLHGNGRAHEPAHNIDYAAAPNTAEYHGTVPDDNLTVDDDTTRDKLSLRDQDLSENDVPPSEITVSDVGLTEYEDPNPKGPQVGSFLDERAPAVPEHDVSQDVSATDAAEDDNGDARCDHVAFLKVAEWNFIAHVFECWRQITKHHAAIAQRKLAHAARWDSYETLSEAVLIWSENADVQLQDVEGVEELEEGDTRRTLHEERKQSFLTFQDADADEPGQEDRAAQATGQGSREQEEGVETETETEAAFPLEKIPTADETLLLNRAAAAWDYFLVSKAFTHWAALSEEEVERTAVARRHILRKKYFGAWVEQKVEDDGRIRTFSQTTPLRQWRDLHCDRQEQTNRAHELYNRGLAAQAFWDWLRAGKELEAVALNCERLKCDSVQAWHRRHLADVEAQRLAASTDRRATLGHGLATWVARANTNSLQEGRVQRVATALDQNCKSESLAILRQVAADYGRKTAAADSMELKAAAKHWILESRLKAYQDDELDRLLTDWFCEARVRVVRRVYERATVMQALDTWLCVSDESRGLSEHEYAVAENLDEAHLVQSALSSAARLLRDKRAKEAEALGIWRSSTQGQAIGVWTWRLEETRKLERWSELGARFSGTNEPFQTWRAAARESYKRRVRERYRDFRYEARCELLRGCLDWWRHATADSIASTWEAEEFSAEEDRAILHGALEHWASKAKDASFFQEVAYDADREACMTTWQLKVEVQREADMDAEDYDTERTLGACWGAWELEARQLRGRDRTVYEAQDHNDRRMRRQILRQWVDLVLPRREPEADFRSSRRSARWGTPARTPAAVRMTPARTPARARPFLLDYGALDEVSEMTFGEDDAGGPDFGG